MTLHALQAINFIIDRNLSFNYVHLNNFRKEEQNEVSGHFLIFFRDPPTTCHHSDIIIVRRRRRFQGSSDQHDGNLQNSSKVKAAVDEVKKIQTESTPKITALSEELTKIQDSLQKGKDSLKAEEKDKLESDFRQKLDELQREQNTARTKIAEKQKTVQDSLQGEIDKIVEGIAKQEGLTVVFMRDYLAYTNNLTDLTDKVTKALDSSKIESGQPKK